MILKQHIETFFMLRSRICGKKENLPLCIFKSCIPQGLHKKANIFHTVYKDFSTNFLVSNERPNFFEEWCYNSVFVLTQLWQVCLLIDFLKTTFQVILVCSSFAIFIDNKIGKELFYLKISAFSNNDYFEGLDWKVWQFDREKNNKKVNTDG